MVLFLEHASENLDGCFEGCAVQELASSVPAILSIFPFFFLFSSHLISINLGGLESIVRLLSLTCCTSMGV